MMNQHSNEFYANEILLNSSKVGDKGYFVLKCYRDDAKKFGVVNTVVVTSGELIFTTRGLYTHLLNGQLKLDIISGRARSIGYLIIDSKNISAATAIEFTEIDDLIEKINNFIHGLCEDEPYTPMTDDDLLLEEALKMLENYIMLFYGLPTRAVASQGITFIDLNS